MRTTRPNEDQQKSREVINATKSKPAEKQTKKTPRLLRSFAQARDVAEKSRRSQQSLVPGMSSYESQDVESDVGNAVHEIGSLSFSTDAARNQTLFQTSDVESDGFGSEEFNT